jgi:hypothetical protein
MSEVIPIYIGISERFREIEGLTEFSIRKNTNANVVIKHIYPERESGCTGFSNVRFHIRHGIYLDPDMIVLGDIAELWAYRKKGKFVCIEDKSTEVAVIDCEHSCRDKTQLKKLPMEPIIPTEWNVEDYRYFPNKPLPKNIKLFHFTSLPHQPWFHEHPHEDAKALYHEYLQMWKDSQKPKAVKKKTISLKKGRTR